LDQGDGIRGLCEADRRFDLKETRFSAEDVAVYVRPNREAEFAETIAQLMAQPELGKRWGLSVVVALRTSCNGTGLAKIFPVG